MRYTTKILPSSDVPAVKGVSADGSIRDLTCASENYDWVMMYVYRGQHSETCTRFLRSLSKNAEDFHALGVEVIGVSADSASENAAHREELGELTIPLFHSLSEDSMEQLGLFISEPTDTDGIDHPFAEPALFVINAEGELVVSHLASSPFVRPNLKSLAAGVAYVKDPENKPAVRGSVDYCD